MYTDEDLKSAVNKGIFSEASVSAFRDFISKDRQLASADEENFKLVSGFNDIFVVIACILLLSCSAWVSYSISPAFAMAVVAVISWGLAEFFVLRRKMSLPAIVLLISFVGSVFACFAHLLDAPSEKAFMVAAMASSAGAWLHWKRFNVPITVAAGIATLAVFFISLLASMFPSLQDHSLAAVFLAGIATFALAMYWDSSDRSRLTGRSDVAFWLHLLAAPLVVHPIFSLVTELGEQPTMMAITIIVTLYLVLSSISLVIDRRAFMVSSLIYVLYALNQFFDTYGLASNSFAIAGVIIGFSLLLLSGYWAKARKQLLNYLPKAILCKVPLAEIPTK